MGDAHLATDRPVRVIRAADGDYITQLAAYWTGQRPDAPSAVHVRQSDTASRERSCTARSPVPARSPRAGVPPASVTAVPCRPERPRPRLVPARKRGLAAPGADSVPIMRPSKCTLAAQLLVTVVLVAPALTCAILGLYEAAFVATYAAIAAAITVASIVAAVRSFRSARRAF